MAVKKTKAIIPYFYKNDFNTIDERGISGLINALISPLFNSKEEINVIVRFLNNNLKNNYLKNYFPRLKFLNTKFYDLETENLDTIEFLIISTKQYNACVVFDFSLSDAENQALFCFYINSKKIEEILKLIMPNIKFPQERRENNELNSAFLNLIRFNKNSITELMINEKEKNNLEDLTQNLKRNEIIAQRARFISHEIKNQLSIIDVYTRITQISCGNNSKITNASEIIFKSIKNITTLLTELKTFSEANLNVYDLSEVINEAVNSIKEMAAINNISLTANILPDLSVILDKVKFQNILINIIKNGIEAFKSESKTDKFIEIATKINDGKISVTIANNGKQIDKKDQSKIFDEGFTTKKDGSGLGLYICKQNLKEQFCELSLIKSTPIITVFEIKMNKT